MGAPHYTPTGNPLQGSIGKSSDLRAEFTAVETGIQVLNAIPMVGYFEDANAAADQIYIVVPWACRLVSIAVTIHEANATADTIFTPKIGGTAVTDGGMTVPLSAIQATVVTATPSALNDLLKDVAIEIETDGGGSSVMPVSVTLVLERT